MKVERREDGVEFGVSKVAISSIGLVENVVDLTQDLFLLA